MMYYAENLTGGKSVFFESRAETYTGIARAAVKAAFGKNCLAKCKFYAAAEVDDASKHLDVSVSVAALMVMLSGLAVYNTETRGMITRVGYRTVVDVHDVYAEAA